MKFLSRLVVLAFYLSFSAVSAQTFLPNIISNQYSLGVSGDSNFGPNIAIFTTTGVNTWDVPPGVTSIRATIISGGGGGGGGFQNAGGGGGGGSGATGAGWWRIPIIVNPGTTCTINVGAGGTGGTGGTSPTSGTAGGLSGVSGTCVLFPSNGYITFFGSNNGLAGTSTAGGTGGSAAAPNFISGGTGVAGNGANGTKSSSASPFHYIANFILPTASGSSGAGNTGTASAAAISAMTAASTVQISGTITCTAPAGCGGAPTYLFYPSTVTTAVVGNTNATALTHTTHGYGAGGGGGGGGTTGGNGATGTQGIVIIEW